MTAAVTEGRRRTERVLRGENTADVVVLKMVCTKVAQSFLWLTKHSDDRQLLAWMSRLF